MPIKSTKKSALSALLSFHDISIENYATIAPILDKLENAGASPCALLIVPYVANTHSADDIAQFRNWLHLRSEKHELILHGYTHKANSTVQRSIFGRIANAINNNEAEFAGLNKFDTKQTLTQALDAWHKLIPNTPVCFTAPTWFDSATLKASVFAHGIHLYESRLQLHSSAQTLFTIPVSWLQSESILSRMASWYFRGIMQLPFCSTIKVALHPIDFSTTDKASRTMSFCQELCARRELISYSSSCATFK